jgi:hypothetical protein
VHILSYLPIVSLVVVVNVVVNVVVVVVVVGLKVGVRVRYVFSFHLAVRNGVVSYRDDSMMIQSVVI